MNISKLLNLRQAFLEETDLFFNIPFKTRDKAKLIENICKNLNYQLRHAYASKVTSVFIGFLNQKPCELFINDLLHNIRIVSDFQITLQLPSTHFYDTNPSLLKKSGVNRICIKALEFEYLNKDVFFNAIQTFGDHGFQIGVDVEYGLPYITNGKFKNFIEGCVKYGVHHFTVESNLSLNGQYFYNFASNILQLNGFHCYGLCNFALSTNCQSRMNTDLWRGKQFIGIGPGGKSSIISKQNPTLTGRFKFEEISNIKEWNKSRELPRGSTISGKQWLEELLFLSLHSIWGLDKYSWHFATNGEKLLTDFRDNIDVEHLVENNIIILNKDRLSINEQQMLMTDNIITTLFNAL